MSFFKPVDGNFLFGRVQMRPVRWEISPKGVLTLSINISQFDDAVEQTNLESHSGLWCVFYVPNSARALRKFLQERPGVSYQIFGTRGSLFLSVANSKADAQKLGFEFDAAIALTAKAVREREAAEAAKRAAEDVLREESNREWAEAHKNTSPHREVVYKPYSSVLIARSGEDFINVRPVTKG